MEEEEFREKLKSAAIKMRERGASKEQIQSFVNKKKAEYLQKKKEETKPTESSSKDVSTDGEVVGNGKKQSPSDNTANFVETKEVQSTENKTVKEEPKEKAYQQTYGNLPTQQDLRIKQKGFNPVTDDLKLDGNEYQQADVNVDELEVLKKQREEAHKKYEKTVALSMDMGTSVGILDPQYYIPMQAKRTFNKEVAEIDAKIKEIENKKLEVDFYVAAKKAGVLDEYKEVKANQDFVSKLDSDSFADFLLELNPLSSESAIRHVRQEYRSKNIKTIESINNSIEADAKSTKSFLETYNKITTDKVGQLRESSAALTAQKKQAGLQYANGEITEEEFANVVNNADEAIAVNNQRIDELADGFNRSLESSKEKQKAMNDMGSVNSVLLATNEAAEMGHIEAASKALYNEAASTSVRQVASLAPALTTLVELASYYQAAQMSAFVPSDNREEFIESAKEELVDNYVDNIATPIYNSGVKLSEQIRVKEKDPTKETAEFIGTTIGQVGKIAVATALTGGAGGGVVSYSMMFDEMYNDISKELEPKEAARLSNMYAAIASPLEYFGANQLVGGVSRKLAKESFLKLVKSGAVKDLTEKESKKVFLKELQTLGTKIASASVESAAVEGITEDFQFIANEGVKHFNNLVNIDKVETLNGSDFAKGLVENFKGGAGAGLMFGLGGGVVNYNKTNYQNTVDLVKTKGFVDEMLNAVELSTNLTAKEKSDLTAQVNAINYGVTQAENTDVKEKGLLAQLIASNQMLERQKEGADAGIAKSYQKKINKNNEAIDVIMNGGGVEEVRNVFKEDVKEKPKTEVKEEVEETIVEDVKEEVKETVIEDIPLNEIEDFEASLEVEKEGYKPISRNKKVFSYNGKQYKISSIDRKKDGSKVVKAKEWKKTKDGRKFGTQKRFTGQEAELIAKDFSLDIHKDKPTKNKVKTKGVPNKDLTIPKETFPTKDKPIIEEDNRTIEEVEKQSEADLKDFTEEVLGELVEVDKQEKRNLVEVGDKVFQVIEKSDGEFSVSQMNEKGKLVGIKDADTRSNAIKEFKEQKNENVSVKIKESEKLIEKATKEEQDKVLRWIEDKIEQMKYDPRNMSMRLDLGLTPVVATTALKIVRETYKATKNLAKAVNAAYEYASSKGYKGSEREFGKAVVKELKTPVTKPKKQKQANEDVVKPKKQSKPPTRKEQQLKDKLEKSKEKIKETKEDFQDRFIEYADSTKAKFKEKLNKLKEKHKQAISKVRENAKEKEKAFRQHKKEVVKQITDYVKDFNTNKYFSRDLSSAINVVGKADTPSQLNRAVQRVTDIVDNASRKKKEEEATKSINKMKGNVTKKLGGAKDYKNKVVELFSLSPKLVPNSVMDSYTETIKAVANKGFNKSVEQTTKDIQKILEAQKEELKKHNKALEIYSKNADTDKTMSENITELKKEGLLTDEQGKLLQKYKNEFKEELTKAQKKVKKEAKEREQERKRKEKADEVSEQKVNPKKVKNKDERKVAESFRNIPKNVLSTLSLNQLNALSKAINNANESIVNEESTRIAETVESRKMAFKANMNSVKKAKWWNVASKVSSLLSGKTPTQSKIETSVLSYIDIAVKNYKDSSIFKNLFYPTARKLGSFNYASKNARHTIEKAAKKLDSGLKQWKSNVKIQMYMHQLEFESNPDSNTSHSAKDIFNTTIESSDSVYNPNDKKEITKAWNELTSKGETAKDMWDNLSPKEKEVYNTLRSVLDEHQEKARYTREVERGGDFDNKVNYTPRPVAVKKDSNVDLIDKTIKMLTTESGFTKERDGRVHPVRYSALDNVSQSVQETLLDYYLSSEVRRANKAFNYLIEHSNGDTNEVANAIKEAYRKVIENVVFSNYGDRSVADSVSDWITRKGYIAILGGIDRPIVEAGSNLIHAGLYNTGALSKGISMLVDGKNKIKDKDLADFFLELGIAQTDRLFGQIDLESKNVESGLLLSGRLGIKVNAPTRSESVLDAVAKTLKKGDKASENFFAKSISLPDQVIGKIVFMGEFANTYKELTGKELTLEDLKNDKFIEENKDVLDEAAYKADTALTDSVASQNPMAGIIANQRTPSNNAMTAAVKNFDNMMTTFRKFEFYSAVKAISNLLSKGELSRFDAIRLLSATVARMMVYSMTRNAYIAPFIYGLFGYKDDEDDRTLAQKINSSFISAATTLAFGRNYGNVVGSMTSLAVNELNEKFGEGITYNKGYDKYQDDLAFNSIQTDGYNPLLNTAINMSGAYSPFIRGAMYGVDNLSKKGGATEVQAWVDSMTLFFLFAASAPKETSKLIKERKKRRKYYRYPIVDKIYKYNKSKRKK